MKNNSIYIFTNLIVFTVSFLLCIYRFYEIHFSVVPLVVLTIAAVMVHFLKALRLYFIISGKGISFFRHLCIYSKTSFVNIALPFKLGEIFRIFSYGHEVGSITASVYMILLDRFIDTASLVFIFVFLNILDNISFSIIVYVLFIFILFVLIAYFVFASTFEFWKKYLIESKSTLIHIQMLNILSVLENMYRNVRNLLLGRGYILFFLSFVSWILELGSIVLLNYIFTNVACVSFISDYLTSALLGKYNVLMAMFSFVSIAIFFAYYLIFHFVKIRTGKNE